jgi:hypothetical protein
MGMKSGEVETIAGKFVKKRYSQVERIFFRTVYPEVDTWELNGEIGVQAGTFLHPHKIYQTPSKQGNR